MKKLITLAALFISFYSAHIFAEYRVYQYYVKSAAYLPQDKNAYLVTTTLDPESYVSYHGGRESIEVELLRSWMCKGYTGENKQYCTAPYDDVPKDNLQE